MLGFTTIDSQPGRSQIAVWRTSRIQELQVGHVNAVVIDVEADPDVEKKVHSLTRESAVLLTDGSTISGLPIAGTPATTADLGDLLAEIAERQAAIVEAVAAYKRKSRSKTLIDPEFPDPPIAAHFEASDDTSPARALAQANFARAVWMSWLKTDDERRRRTVQPRTEITPWIMPEELNAPNVPDLPARFAARIQLQPAV